MDFALTVRKQPLKVIPAPRVGHLLVPPVLTASSHTVDYTCGYCGHVLVHDEKGQVQGLLIRCPSCGSYNETE